MFQAIIKKELAYEVFGHLVFLCWWWSAVGGASCSKCRGYLRPAPATAKSQPRSFWSKLFWKGSVKLRTLFHSMDWWCGVVCWGPSSDVPLLVDIPVVVSVTVRWFCSNLRDCDPSKSIICLSSIIFCRAKSPPLWFLFIISNEAFTNPSLLKETEDWYLPSDTKLEGISYVLYSVGEKYWNYQDYKNLLGIFLVKQVYFINVKQET